MSKKKETSFKEQVQLDIKKLKQCWGFKTDEKARRGIPDIILSLHGRFVAIELKTDEGEPDPLQTLTIEKIRATDAIAFITQPSLWKEHYKLLESVR